MREELHGELVEKHAQEWRPQRYGWTNPANSPASRAAHDKAITICVTRGRSARTTHRLTKPRASIGKMGGGADMQIDDPEVCPLHCAVAMTENGSIRMPDSLFGGNRGGQTFSIHLLSTLRNFVIDYFDF